MRDFIYFIVGADKFNVETVGMIFFKLIQRGEEVFKWGMYPALTLLHILGQFDFYLKDPKKYINEIILGINSNVRKKKI